MSDSPSSQQANRDPETAIHSHDHDQMVTPVTPLPKERKARASWKDNEQQILPENRLGIVLPGLMCCIFLAALDQVYFQVPLILPSH